MCHAEKRRARGSSIAFISAISIGGRSVRIRLEDRIVGSHRRVISCVCVPFFLSSSLMVFFSLNSNSLCRQESRFDSTGVWEWLRINCIWCDVILNVGYVNESSLFTREPLLYTRANVSFGRKNRLHEKKIYIIYNIKRRKKYIYIIYIYIWIYSFTPIPPFLSCSFTFFRLRRERCL